MVSWGWLIAAVFIGAIAGFFIASLLAAASRN